jgi:hypothetical protein
MEKFLYSGMEEGGEYQTRSSEFAPIDNYRTILDEVENVYTSLTGSKLFTVYEGDKIVVVAADCRLSHGFDYDVDAMLTFLKSNGNSEWMIHFCSEKMEEMYVSDIIEKIAQPGQTISIQLTDTLYGNSEFEITT